MLSQGQFFDPANFDISPEKLNFDQFRRKADYYHGQYSYLGHHDWDENTPQTHAGTLKAAQERLNDQYWVGGSLTKRSKPTSVIYPLRHVGEYDPEVISDRGEDWDYLGEHRSQMYKNDYEDAGSISVVGPAHNFQTYHQYVDSLPNPTERQLAERQGNAYEPYTPIQHTDRDADALYKKLKGHPQQQAFGGMSGVHSNPAWGPKQ